MGLAHLIVVNVLLVMGIVGFLRKPGTLMMAAKDLLRRPFFNLFLLTWISCLMVAGWGIVSGGHLSRPIRTPWGRIDSWELAGLLSFAGLLIVSVSGA